MAPRDNPQYHWKPEKILKSPWQNRTGVPKGWRSSVGSGVFRADPVPGVILAARKGEGIDDSIAYVGLATDGNDPFREDSARSGKIIPSVS